MRFPYQVVHDFEGVQNNFEALQAKSILDVTRGTAKVTWPGGSPNTGVLTVQHGLGVVPTVVLAGDMGGAAFIVAPEVGVFTKSTFALQCRTADGSSPTGGSQQTIGWTAIP